MAGSGTYIAFLRGINVGGHHKVPMKELQVLLKTNGYSNVITILNSGNIIFDTNSKSAVTLEKELGALLESNFGFPVPTIVRTEDEVRRLWSIEPFKDHELTKEKRFYISLLRQNDDTPMEIPFVSEDGSFQILMRIDANIISVLDLGLSGTPQAMAVIEKVYGKDVTTRNWKTIERVIKKLEA